MTDDLERENVSGHPRLLRAVLWRRVDQPAFDHCRLWTAGGAHSLEGCVLIAVGGAPCEVRYAVECDEAWHTRATRVTLATGATERALELRRDAAGVWRRDGETLADMEGLLDVDLGFTPATNTLPIRRLSLGSSEAADVSAVWVRFPELTVERLEQRYTRLDRARYRYGSGGGAFVAELEVDEFGLVSGYEGIAERVAAWTAEGRS